MELRCWITVTLPGGEKDWEVMAIAYSEAG